MWTYLSKPRSSTGTLNRNWTAPGQWFASTEVTSQPSISTVTLRANGTTNDGDMVRVWSNSLAVSSEQKIIPFDQLGLRPA